MIIQKKMPFSTKITSYTYALLTGISVLLSTVEAGRLDDVEVISLNNASGCQQCMACPLNQNIGGCGENFVKKLLTDKKIETHFAQYDKVHGIDLVAFTKIKGKDLIILHESKMSKSASITAAEFKSRLGAPKSGRQGSRTWLNYALNKMKESKDVGTRQLALTIETTLNKGAYFIRTGNLRVDTKQDARLQFYALTDKNSEVYALEGEAGFVAGPFIRTGANQHGKWFDPHSNELPLDMVTVAWLNALFNN
ncbi:hypothetical protein [Candidatus Odyssella acanthamoebae]|uniref:Uncharacterized protein n=1 Tax=Candidatus Odyssella acanthamoebae TaxID=91604 RepID=A0A077AT04_9PROT|nr:hypothetical protein [Candidatus Paracaedibacter acanthamoebae]AIK96337.1 hypothetical protein ID47_05705 [Candidatus Paracaedibacter acanthamoebae]